MVAPPLEFRKPRHLWRVRFHPDEGSAGDQQQSCRKTAGVLTEQPTYGLSAALEVGLPFIKKYYSINPKVFWDGGRLELRFWMRCGDVQAVIRPGKAHIIPSMPTVLLQRLLKFCVVQCCCLDENQKKQAAFYAPDSLLSTEQKQAQPVCSFKSHILIN